MKEPGQLVSKLKAMLPQKQNNPAVSGEETLEPKNKVLQVIKILFLSLYRLRGIIISIPVVILALRLAAYNSEHLPLLVGLNLQSTGEYAKMISRSTAVMMPLMLTGGCIVLTIFSRKTLYPWLISLFSLTVPVLLLITNLYPA